MVNTLQTEDYLDKNLNMVYFSPTKTTKKILENIAYEIGNAKIVNFDLTYPQNANHTQIKFSDEIVIIGAPVYAGRLPDEAVKRFKQIKAKNTLAIIVVVYGNREFEDALLELKNLVIKIGFTPIAGGAFVAEHSFSTKETPIAHGRPDSLDIQNVKEFALKIKEKIRTTDTFQVDLKIPGDFPYKDAMPPNKIAPMYNEELCHMCGECVELCPTGAIFMLDNIVTNPQLCIRCCACIKCCPKEARFIDDESWKAIRTKLSTNCSIRKEPQIFL